MVSLDLFAKGDVYLDYRFEDMKFRFDKATGKVYVRSEGGPEVEIERSYVHYRDAISSGEVITREQYFSDEVAPQ